MLSPLLRLRGARSRLQDQIERLAKIMATTPIGTPRYRSHKEVLERLKDMAADLDARIARAEQRPRGRR